MRAILDPILRRFIVLGRLTVRWPDGQLTTYTGEPGPEALMALRSSAAVRRIALNPALAVGEAYMDGDLVPVDCTIHDVLDLLVINLNSETSSLPVYKFRAALKRMTRALAQFNPASRSRRNVAHHYDLNGRLYSLFLDRDRQYSCAYFPRGDETLEEAQVAKKRHIASKLRLDRPDLTVLDIGCGWGGMALTLARDYGARVTGITLSTEQLDEARARASAEGLADRVTFELLDYRSLHRCFDRIVSVGMFEHVGVGHYRTFFEVTKRCLAPDGIALLHAIGRHTGPDATNPWIAKYIFPGGYSPALSEVLPAIEKSGLVTTDIEILRLHYAETLRHWRRRFAANRDAIMGLYDERFCRMFEFYLSGSELAFRREGHMVFQIQLARDQRAVPLSRDYMVDTERKAAASACAAAGLTHGQGSAPGSESRGRTSE
ncbi:SAM-dependent methyltransferase [Limobrevibacterium gyesilva]|uniref:Cyclopropane-fatty-acyl-phospholipid synthase family protein n=1 Tax=Limobrevibacterium gyesilva TaxID=2991712 RepID=A0AA41YH63_9PROT|nr:cyclopropane-fatty-acyl-phospholipid synthase family protein [Limobrevibacterium gyesilva]MCW3473129.1 cyclopropane-fatty-acyl-phospholipid synthase family protein [Limobrevibacterium gyesilva]